MTLTGRYKIGLIRIKCITFVAYEHLYLTV